MNINESLAWVAEVFEEPAEKIRPETQRKDLPGWDSLGVLALIAGFDKDFDIVLEPEAIQAMTCVGDILEILRRHGKLKEKVAGQQTV